MWLRVQGYMRAVVPCVVGGEVNRDTSNLCTVSIEVDVSFAALTC
jgi:hypothetical protein